MEQRHGRLERGNGYRLPQGNAERHAGGQAHGDFPQDPATHGAERARGGSLASTMSAPPATAGPTSAADRTLTNSRIALPCEMLRP